MRLTMQTDHAFRILMAIAKAEGKVQSVDYLARYFKVSKNHLTKTAQALAAAGFVRTVRGRNGGLLLARKADEINVADVVRSIEPDMSLAECFSKPGCVFLPQCRLKKLLFDARSKFMEELSEKTLADIIA